MAPLQDDWVLGTCKIGKGAETCRYLIGSMQGMQCGKHLDGIKQTIDRAVEAGTMKAHGDNCEGFEYGTAATE